MIKQSISYKLADLLTLLWSFYEKRLLPRLWRLKRLPGGKTLVETIPDRFFGNLIKIFGFFSKPSEIYHHLEQDLPNLLVAQIGGVTRSQFDCAGTVISFNTHDWRSGEDSKNDGRYVKTQGVKLPVEDEFFDIVASRHVLEHISNPIMALLEWKRVLKKGGYIYISLPDRRKTEERGRNLTKLNHFIEDYQNNIPEFDMTHEEEIKYAKCGIIDHDKYENPHIHYHTFEEKNVKDLLNWCGYKVVDLSLHDLNMLRYKPWDLIVMANKP